MKREVCIFSNKKSCNDCGECEKCDLNANKKCNNCGKCLEMEGYDMKAIKIDEIIEDDLDSKEAKIELENNKEFVAPTTSENDMKEVEEEFEQREELYDEYIDDYEVIKEKEDEDVWNDNIEYIDDIDGLNELLEDEDKLKELTSEEFPGFIRFKGRNDYN
ncbi:hypothetical protein [Clostridium aciditolerans]|uniref:Uncharacterized protein n=1 Tax=Clostridium aciditolerans TaxID=339861 RepID=A0A934HSG9_9CLOT|nr:hypothetical protein [Clostridium aciditolerans]MBI6872478.1 hypothetical protein [Clostridium aciditolerans]